MSPGGFFSGATGRSAASALVLASGMPLNKATIAPKTTIFTREWFPIRNFISSFLSRLSSSGSVHPIHSTDFTMQADTQPLGHA